MLTKGPRFSAFTSESPSLRGGRRIVSVSFFQSNVCNLFRKLPVVRIIEAPARPEVIVMEPGNVRETLQILQERKVQLRL